MRVAATTVPRLQYRRTYLVPSAPVLVLGGNGDYNLAQKRRDYPAALLREWPEIDPNTDVRFTTLSRYIDAVAPVIAIVRSREP